MLSSNLNDSKGIRMLEHLRIEKLISENIDMVYELYRTAHGDNLSTLEWLKDSLSDPNAYIYIAYFENEIIAFCGMYHNTSCTPRYCKIGNIVVKEKYRRKGIGKTLMKIMLDTTSELGVDVTKLEVETKNNAVQLYKSMGFIIEKTEKCFYDNGADAYIMWRYSDNE